MPIYEYQCASCGHRFERIQKFSDPPVASCPACGGEVQKLISSPAIQFKGSGFYITDYPKPGQPGKESSAEAGGATNGQGTDKAAAEKKSGGDQAATAPAPKTESAPKGSAAKTPSTPTSD
jgi:putative FmdB family regulatory protein